MKCAYALISLLLLVSVNTFSKFYSIKSEREFDRKLQDYEYSLVCFAQDDAIGLRIKEMMRTVANSDEFADLEFALLFVYAGQESLRATVRKYHYTHKPLFVLFHRYDEIAQSNLGEHYSVDVIRNFINENVQKKGDRL